MAAYAHSGSLSQNSSERGLAMVNNLRFYDTKWSSGFVLPMVLSGLIIAIKTTSPSSSSSTSIQSRSRASLIPSSDPSWVLRIGSSSWGLAAILAMLMLVLACQESVQQYLRK
uniref:Uncharacterized protein n=2 Tax=Manihot esculenta TaxID=3983 RepID=A0A2C9W2P9_MANES